MTQPSQPLRALITEAGFGAEEIDTITFGDIDSLLAAELIGTAESVLRREIAFEAFGQSDRVADLLALVDDSVAAT